MYSMHRYAHLHDADNKATPMSPTWRSTNWFRSRKLRNVLLVSLLVLIVFTSARHRTDISPRLRQLYDKYEHTEFSPFVTPDVRWSDFAYTQYVTNENYLCNSLMIFESLHRLKSKADRVMMYPRDWTVPDDDGANSTFASKSLAQARDQYGVKLVPIEVLSFKEQEITWADSFTKLLAFNQTQYKRVVNVDSDSTIVKNMDELFFLPPAPVAMPRAYWLTDTPNFLSSQLVVIEPSAFEFSRIQSAIQNHTSSDFDMEIVNNLYGDSCIMLPHRQYDLITGEMRQENHAPFLGSKEAEWNVTRVMEDVKFVHFSDWPFPKPWLKASEEQWKEATPKSEKERDVWAGIYKDFSERRERICGRTYDNDIPAAKQKRNMHARRIPRGQPTFK